MELKNLKTELPKDSWTQPTVWGLWGQRVGGEGEEGVRGINGNGKNIIKIKVKIKLPGDPAIPCLGIYPNKLMSGS